MTLVVIALIAGCVLSLFLVGAVYAAFVVAQVSATFGDVADVLDDPYATRARVHEGFFALLTERIARL